MPTTITAGDFVNDVMGLVDDFAFQYSRHDRITDSESYRHNVLAYTEALFENNVVIPKTVVSQMLSDLNALSNPVNAGFDDPFVDKNRIAFIKYLLGMTTLGSYVYSKSVWDAKVNIPDTIEYEIPFESETEDDSETSNVDNDVSSVTYVAEINGTIVESNDLSDIITQILGSLDMSLPPCGPECTCQ